MKKKIFLAIFLIVSMVVPAFSYQWKGYDGHNKEDLKKFKELVTKEFYLIRDEIFAPVYPEVKDVELVWDFSEEDWKKTNSFYNNRIVRIKPYIDWDFLTEEKTLTIIHELSHAVKHLVLNREGGGGHDKEFVEILYKMTDEFLIRVFDGTLKSYMFTDISFFRTKEGIEMISRFIENDSGVNAEKKDLTISNLRKKLGLKIL